MSLWDHSDVRVIFVFQYEHRWMKWIRSETFSKNKDQHDYVRLHVRHSPSWTVHGPPVCETHFIFNTLFIQKCIRKGKENYLLPLNFWTIAFVSCFTDDRLLVFAPSLSRIETWLLLIDRRYSEISSSNFFPTVKRVCPVFGKMYIFRRA